MKIFLRTSLFFCALAPQAWAADAAATSPVVAISSADAPKSSGEATIAMSTTGTAAPMTTTAATSDSTTASVMATPVATPVAKARKSKRPAFAQNFGHWAVGVGYPDVRLRLGLGNGFSVEGKAAFDTDIQVYTGRLSYNFLDLGPLRMMLSGEAGVANLANVGSVSTTGTIYGASLGAEYPFAKRFRISVDVGPMKVSASNSVASYSTTDIVYNTALYLYLF